MVSKGSLFLFLCLVVRVASAQPIIVKTMTLEQNYGAGTSQYIANAYTGAGDVTNSYEFLPAGYNSADETVKYGVIFYFPGVGDVKTSNPVSVTRLGLRALPVEIEGGLFPSGFPFIVIGMQGSASSPASEYASFMENYIYIKYANKIDFSRIYLTGLSMGGGRIMEYMTDATRASKIAAIAPVAPGTECPFTKGCTPSSTYLSIINNIVANNSMGVFFTHNLLDPTVPAQISANYRDDINALTPGKVKSFFDPTNPNHDAWSDAYSAAKSNFEGMNMYNWLAQYSLSGTTLPVVLTNFTAMRSASGEVSLRWGTANESESSFFSVERSADGSRFKEIGKVNAAGNSSTAKSYIFTDMHPLDGTSYYRLRLSDKDGKFSYSPVRKLSGRAFAMDVKAGPNPTSGSLTVSVTSQQKGLLTITVSDLTGRTLKSMQVVKNGEVLTQLVDVSSFSPGMYTLRVKGGESDQVMKIVKR